jgi:hypothetical protein
MIIPNWSTKTRPRRHVLADDPMGRTFDHRYDRYRAKEVLVSSPKLTVYPDPQLRSPYTTESPYSVARQPFRNCAVQGRMPRSSKGECGTPSTMAAIWL